jgi:CO dehydrogenase/acetyl-CoA synthase beta subunit
MDLFPEQFAFIDDWLAGRRRRQAVRQLEVEVDAFWPAGGKRNLVIGQDVAVELGHPEDGSLATLIWRESRGAGHGGRTWLVGPDLPEATGRRLPLAKVVMIHGRGFDADNTYVRYRQLEAVRYAIDLKGYMMRAASRSNREWGRVSHAALAGGFSLGTLGNALIGAYTALDYVDRADVLMVTSGRADVMAFQPLADRVRQVITAMSGMSAAMDLDCGDCSFAPVCDAVDGLRTMHQALEEKQKHD